MPIARKVFITGGTGYIGRPLIEMLRQRGHGVLALARPGSEGRLPPGCACLVGNALAAGTFSERVPAGCTYVHLIGVAHPSPAKARQFRLIDQKALEVSIEAALRARAQHFIYLSVARPAPVMQVYQQVRAECEASITQAGLRATFVRPWYVLGPGHRWPYALLPFYRFAEAIPALREGARRLGLVTLEQMVATLASAVDNPPEHQRIIEVPEIKAARWDHYSSTRVVGA